MALVTYLDKAVAALSELRIPAGWWSARRLPRLLATVALMLGSAGAMGTSSAIAAPFHLRIVGGFSTVYELGQQDRTDWTQSLSERTAGRVSAEIVPFDHAGIRKQEFLRLMQLGMLPFGMAPFSPTLASDADLVAPDLAGVAANMDELKRMVAAYRPYLVETLRERYGIHLLALYTYPAQVIFCKQPFRRLGDLAGRRIRIATPSQSDFLQGLGALPVPLAFSDIVSSVKSDNVDCAVTGTMSGNSIGLSDVARYVHSMPLSWGLSLLAANIAAWNAIPSDVRQLLLRELPRIESEMWAEAERQTHEGVACNAGRAGCLTGRKGQVIEVPLSAPDNRLRRRLVESMVLPRWIGRCNVDCVALWNRTLKPVTEIEVLAPMDTVFRTVAPRDTSNRLR